MVVNNLSKRFGKKQALNSVSFRLDQRCTALLGPNGAGKTTLIKCLTNLVTPTSGFVGLDSESELEVGYLPQHFNFLPNLTVREALTYLGTLSNIDDENLKREITSVVNLTNLSDYENTKIKALSGGTMRRLGVAQALLGSPQLLLLDEPTASLDIEERGKLKAVLARAKEVCSILIATHLTEDIVGLCDRALVLYEGRIIFDGEVENMASFAKGRVIESVDETPRFIGGVSSGTLISDGSTKYRFVMPATSSEYCAEPNIEDGYLALLHDCSGDKGEKR